jgi:hypothetical protein
MRSRHGRQSGCIVCELALKDQGRAREADHDDVQAKNNTDPEMNLEERLAPWYGLGTVYEAHEIRTCLSRTPSGTARSR